MSGAGKGEAPWAGKFTDPDDQPVDVPELTDLLHDTRIPQRILAELSGVPKNAIGRWSRGSLEPRYERAVKVLDAMEVRLRERLSRVKRVRRAVEATRPRRDRTRRPRVEVEYVEDGGEPSLVVDGEEVELSCRGRPKAATYLLYRDGEVVYVGHSTNLFWRLGHHERDRHFDSYAYADMETKREAIDVERALIQKLDPEDNDQ